MKKLLLLAVLYSSATCAWSPLSDSNTKTIKEFTVKHSKTISMVTGTLILILVAYKTTYGGAVSELKVEDFFPIK